MRVRLVTFKHVLRRNIIAVFLFLLLGFTPGSDVYADIESAFTRGSVGDIPNHLISPPGVMIDVMNNDFMGGTDKYMTGQMKFAYSKLYPKGSHDYVSSFEFHVSWRALTPADYDKFGGNKLNMQIGRFGDWLDSELAYARTYPLMSDWRIKYQGAIGPGHVGNKGARKLQIAIHKLTNNPTANLTYVNQKTGITFRHGVQVGLIPPTVLNGFEMLFSSGYNHDEVMRDLYVQFNLIGKITPWMGFGTELSASRQLSSSMYGSGIDLGRYEASTALILCKYYQPSIKWVSSYLRGDQVPQTYIEFLRFNVPL
jgi:hypothetical protein